MEYFEIVIVFEKIVIFEYGGYDLIGYFIFLLINWLDSYYMLVEEWIYDFFKCYRGDLEVEELIKMECWEMDLYSWFKNWFSYGFYVVCKWWVMVIDMYVID